MKTATVTITAHLSPTDAKELQRRIDKAIEKIEHHGNDCEVFFGVGTVFLKLSLLGECKEGNYVETITFATGDTVLSVGIDGLEDDNEAS